MPTTVAYARVSTDQSLEQQRDQLTTAGYGEMQLYSDQLSGSAGAERLGYAKVVAALTDGDTVVVVVGIDRLGRSAAEVATTAADLTSRGIVRALRDGLDTATATGRIAGMMANVLVVQRMLGHASAAMTLDTYADLLDHDLNAVADVVGTMWAMPKCARGQRSSGSRVGLSCTFDGALGEIRTHTVRVLNPFPLPVGIRGRWPCGSSP